jgi:luciferase-like monooxygenase
MKIRNELVNSGLALSHNMLPHSRWISYWVHKNKEDMPPAVIELIRIRYE